MVNSEIHGRVYKSDQKIKIKKSGEETKKMIVKVKKTDDTISDCSRCAKDDQAHEFDYKVTPHARIE